VEPTNNWVERVLRPAVIARKVSQCSKNQAGAYAFAAFKRVIQTLVKRNAGSLVEALYALFRLQRPNWPLANSFTGVALITYMQRIRSLPGYWSVERSE
jgi:hypothetical protein